MNALEHPRNSPGCPEGAAPRIKSFSYLVSCIPFDCRSLTFEMCLFEKKREKNTNRREEDTQRSRILVSEDKAHPALRRLRGWCVGICFSFWSWTFPVSTHALRHFLRCDRDASHWPSAPGCRGPGKRTGREAVAQPQGGALKDVLRLWALTALEEVGCPETRTADIQLRKEGCP